MVNLMKIKSITLLITVLGFSVFITSCLPLAVGGAAGYVAHKEGYRVSNPVSKE